MKALDMIIDTVWRETGVTRDAILSRSRDMKTTQARQLVMWLARWHTGMSFPRIGQMLGRDHSTVMHAVGKIDALRDTRRDGFMLMPAALRLLDLADRCEAALLREKASATAEWPAALAAMRAHYAGQARAWRAEGRWEARQRAFHRAERMRGARCAISRPVAVTMPRRARVFVPRGCSLTAVMLGDPPPGRSALDRRRHQPRIDWRTRIHAAISASRRSTEERAS